MGSNLISISVAVSQTHSTDAHNQKNKSENLILLNEDLLLETPTVKYKSADQTLNFNRNIASYKPEKIKEISKVREKSRQEQKVSNTLMVSQQ